jgi:hypothetical protein
MKNLLILIVGASLYFHFYPNEKVTQYYESQVQYLQSFFSEMGNTKLQLKADKIYTDLENELDSFSDKEVERLKVITSHRTVVKEFYQSICKKNQRDIVFHITNEKKVCTTIGRYKNLF